jgi:hypothetical protein
MADGRLRYRVRLKQEGQISDSIYWSKKEALTHQALLAAEVLRHAGRTVGEALDTWYQEKLELGLARATTILCQKPRMRLVFSEYLDANLTSITAERARAIYRSLV